MGSRSAAAKLGGDGRAAGGRGPAFGFQPVVDGKVIAAHPFDPVAPAVSANVPLLIGTNLNEFIHGVDQPDADSLTNEDLLKQFNSRYGAKAQAIVDSLGREYTWAKPFDIFSIAGNRLRETSATQARRKAALGAAPAYVYLFGWQTPMLDGRPRAFHSCEISFVFNNADLCVNYSGGTPEALALTRKVSQAWVSFARTGDPNHSGLPKWSPVSEGKLPVMYFDNTCVVKNDPESEARKLMAENRGREDHTRVVAAAVDLQIGTAGERGGDTDAHLAGADRRHRHALGADVLPAVEHGGEHALAHCSYHDTEFGN